MQNCHEYETIVIIRPDVDAEGIDSVVEKLEDVVKADKGHILDREDWGNRKLAYMIEKHLRGYYVRFAFLSSTNVVAEIERRIRIDDKVIRFMTVRVADAVDVPARIEEAAAERAAREEEERKRAEAEAALAREAEEASRIAAQMAMGEAAANPSAEDGGVEAPAEAPADETPADATPDGDAATAD